jgi:hypothetical protein
VAIDDHGIAVVLQSCSETCIGCNYGAATGHGFRHHQTEALGEGRHQEDGYLGIPTLQLAFVGDERHRVHAAGNIPRKHLGHTERFANASQM